MDLNQILSEVPTHWGITKDFILKIIIPFAFSTIVIGKLLINTQNKINDSSKSKN